LARVGDKWSVLIIVLLSNGSKRFTEIKRTIGGISQRMLTLTLSPPRPEAGFVPRAIHERGAIP
jgi:DNA-binding HxlR family transcriptional regulator